MTSHYVLDRLEAFGRQHATTSAAPLTDEGLWALASSMDPVEFGERMDKGLVTVLRDAYDDGRHPCQVRLEAVVAELAKLGVTAVVKHTSGGTATLYAGPRADTPNVFDVRPYAVVLGPGDFGPGGPYIDTAETVTYGSGDVKDDSHPIPYLAQAHEVAALVAVAVENVVACRWRVQEATEAQRALPATSETDTFWVGR